MKKQIFLTSLLAASFFSGAVMAEELAAANNAQANQTAPAQDMMASNNQDNTFAPAQPEGFGSAQDDDAAATGDNW